METYDPKNPDVLRDPHAVFASLREQDPVHFCEPISGWIVTDYALVDDLLMRTDGVSADRIAPFVARMPEPQRSLAEEILRWLGLWMVFQDAPDHTRIRRHLAQAINPRIVGDLREPVTQIVGELLDELPEGESLDFLQRFAMRLPGYVVMDLLGVPRDRLADVQGWADDMMLFVGSARGVEDKYERARRGAYSMADLFRELITDRRASPREDVLTHMINSEMNGDRLTDDELIASMMMLGNGAQATTAHLIVNSLTALDRNPGAADDLRRNPDIVASAVEEFLRFDGPVLSVGRLMIADGELGGKKLSEGERVFAMLTAANRDPKVFESPDQVDLRRAPNRHLAFSKGGHFCLGAPLARLEVQIALLAILDRYETISITEPLEEIPWVNSLTSRGPTRFPVQLN
jgi:cytochrome P450